MSPQLVELANAVSTVFREKYPNAGLRISLSHQYLFSRFERTLIGIFAGIAIMTGIFLALVYFHIIGFPNQRLSEPITAFITFIGIVCGGLIAISFLSEPEKNDAHKQYLSTFENVAKLFIENVLSLYGDSVPKKSLLDVTTLILVDMAVEDLKDQALPESIKKPEVMEKIVHRKKIIRSLIQSLEIYGFIPDHHDHYEVIYNRAKPLVNGSRSPEPAAV